MRDNAHGTCPEQTAIKQHWGPYEAILLHENIPEQVSMPRNVRLCRCYPDAGESVQQPCRALLARQQPWGLAQADAHVG
jgi:hypothetical protein